MSLKMLTAACLLACAGATTANADVVLNLGSPNLAGAQSVVQTPQLAGTLLAFVLSFDFEPDAAAQLNGSYASDAALAIQSPITVPVQWGGYDTYIAGPTTFIQDVWSFDGPESAEPGAYTDIRTDVPVGLFGSGAWSVRFGNGWFDSSAVQYNSVTLTLIGVQAVPATGGLAALGVAGVGMLRRPRRR